MCYESCGVCGKPVKRSVAALLITDGVKYFFHTPCATDKEIEKRIVPSVDGFLKKEKDSHNTD